MIIYIIESRDLKQESDGGCEAKLPEWLTDNEITAVLDILRSQFPNIQGFQSTLRGQNLSFKRLSGSFIQIIHADGNHWITVEGVRASFVKVYDSMYRSTTANTKMQIAQMTNTLSENHIDIHIQHTLFQQGRMECGLYATAFAVEMCFGNNPAAYRLVFMAAS